MSEAGKVLRLYVEVRSVAEEEGKLLGNEGSGQLMLQCPDVLPHSPKSSNRPSPNCSPALSPVPEIQLGVGNSASPSKNSSRHSVTFQLQDPDVTLSPGQVEHQDALYDSFGQLLQVLAPETIFSGERGSQGQTCSEMDPYQGRVLISPSSISSERMTVPSPPSSFHRSCAVPAQEDKEGKTSVVTYGYIEKSNVHSMSGRRITLGQSELDEPFYRMDEQSMPQVQKRLSDPLWYNGQLGRDDPNINHPFPSQNWSPRGSPYMKRATIETVAKDATYRALEEFGSPMLQQRFSGNNGVNSSPTLPRNCESPHCRSWSGSPVLARSALTLPPNMSRNSFHGLHKSHVTDLLCAHTGYPSHSVAPPPSICSHGLSQRQSRTWAIGESPRFSSKGYPVLPAGRPTDIQHEISSRRYPIHNYSRTCYQASENPQRVIDNTLYTANSNLPSRTHDNSSCSSSRTSDVVSPISSRRSISPSSNTDVACKPAVEARKLSTAFTGRRTPSPAPSQPEPLRSDSPRTEGSFLLECEQYATFHGQRSPEQNYRRKTDQATPQTRPGRISPVLSQKGLSYTVSPAFPLRLHDTAPSQSPILESRQQWVLSPWLDMSTPHQSEPRQYMGDRKLSVPEPRLYDRLHRSSRDSPEVYRTILSSQVTESPVSWTSRHHEWREAGPVQHRGEPCENYKQLTPCKNGHHKKAAEDKGLKMSQQTPVISVSKDQIEVLDHSGTAGISSHSSSGVTGSVGDSSQLSPETLSQSSHMADSASGMQSSSRSAKTLSSRSQKIARAKWEFLFGGQTEESRCRTDAPPTTPPTSRSPSPTPSYSIHLRPANSRRGPQGLDHKLSHHKVRQINVELVTPDPCDSAPKTGIIRHTIKYSETDLDAVPLRCYRETDLDEVMRAEAEVAEEGAMTFGCNRRIQEKTTLNLNDASVKLQVDDRKEEEERTEGEDGVATWASVRMLGDRQRGTEEEEVFSVLLRRPSDTPFNAHGDLKSPISIGSPRRPSDSNLDSFSRHFESIMESHRAKGTSYSSLDSVDLLTSGSISVFTFDLPTLTPEIQSQICENAKQISDLSFAPLAHPDPPVPPETSCSEISLSALGEGLQSGSKGDSGPPLRSRSEKDSWKRSILKDGFRKASSAPSLHSGPRERLVNCPPELPYLQAAVAERLVPGGSDDVLPNGMKPDLQAAKRLAKRLYNLDGFRKSDVARHLGKNNEFSQMVVEEYLSNFDFSGMTIDQALRAFLRKFVLIGETQERERILAHFSKRYRRCNSESETTEDSVHTLTCAVMLLNTDLHGNNVGKRMSCSQFISNLEGLNNGKDFPKDLLKTLYSSIKNEKLQWTIDEEELRKSTSELADVRTDSASHTMKRLGSGGNPLVGVAQQVNGELYKSGFLVRKLHADPDGKRTPRGKRGWKSFYVMLKGLVLYLQKDEYRTERELTEEDVKNAVSVHHSLAMRAADYSKRPHVFYLRTADWRVFLFQAPNAEEMQSWITRINVLAAMFSAPPFPAAIGSQKRFSRPLLPGSSTKLTQEEQVKSHENRFRLISSELSDLAASTPDHKVKGRELEEQKVRQEYLEFEKTRYGTYAMLLRAKMASGDEDLATFESRLFNDSGLQRAHSSPSLPQDSAPTKDKSRGSKKTKSLKVTSCSSSDAKIASVNQQAGGKKNGSGDESQPQEEAA